MLIALLPLIPLLGLAFLPAGKKRSAIWISLSYLATFLLSLYLLLQIKSTGTIYYQIKLKEPFSPSFSCGPLTLVFLLLTSFIWFLVSLYSPSYLIREDRPRIFQAITSLTLSAVLGVFLAADLFTLLLFFEIMTVASYFWVIHSFNKKSIKAGYYYLFFSIAGGLLIALGLVLFGEASSGPLTFNLDPQDLVRPDLLHWSLGLMLAGFGIKAGMVPFHLWLPFAHSAAPTPASALLSGLLLKVGAYGLLRTGQLIGWSQLKSLDLSYLGQILMSAGLLTMLLGVISALLQSDAKRLLAYHSISQMGYIILAIGTGLFLKEAGDLAFMGALYHIINHALFKALLFLGIGLIYLVTSTTDLSQMGALWQKLPWTAVFMLIGALGITGTPGFNGYASKTLIHHGLLKAVEEGGRLVFWQEKLFSLVGIGTVASFSKLYYLAFLQKGPNWQFKREKFQLRHLALLGLAIPVFLLGMRPEFLPEKLLWPAAQSLGFIDSAALAQLNFFTLPDLLSMLLTLALGIVFCWAGLKFGFFNIQIPAYLTLTGLIKLTIGTAGRLRGKAKKLLAGWLERVKLGYRQAKIHLLYSLKKKDQVRQDSVGKITLVGSSADFVLIVLTLVFLIAWYILTDF